MSTQSFRIDSGKVVHETIDGEVILIHLGTGNYYSLGGSGAEIWELLEQDSSPAEIAEEMGRRHGESDHAVAPTVRSLLQELVAEGLLVAGDSPFEGRNGELVAGEALNGTSEFPAPVLTRYTDMQDFLLVDPIHEVDDSGWPNRK